MTTELPALPQLDPYLAAHPEATPRLNAALAKAQGMVEAAQKDSKNPAFMREEGGVKKASTYASLAAVITAIRDAFAACEIAYPQTTLCEEAHVTVFTHLRHSSGEALVSPFKVPVVVKTPQGFGSASSYARRFGLLAAAGLATEDDDGNEHSSDPKVKATKTEPKKPEPSTEKLTPAATVAKMTGEFAKLGVGAEELVNRLGHGLDVVTHAEFASLREFYAEKQKTHEAERAEAGIAAEKAFKEAQNAKAADPKTVAKLQGHEDEAEAAAMGRGLPKTDGPAQSKEVQRNAAFKLLDLRIKDAPTPEAVTLLLAGMSAEPLFTALDVKAAQRLAENRVLILKNAADLAKAPKRLVIEDVPF